MADTVTRAEITSKAGENARKVLAQAARRNHADFQVLGTPVPQGSMVSMRGRIRHVDSDRLNQWRNDIKAACHEEMHRPLVGGVFASIWDGPVELALYFTYKAPTKAQHEKPKTTAPDVDKLTRAVLDALTGVLYVDDRQVVRLEARKDYGYWEPAYDGGPEETHLIVSAWRKP